MDRTSGSDPPIIKVNASAPDNDDDFCDDDYSAVEDDDDDVIALQDMGHSKLAELAGRSRHARNVRQKLLLHKKRKNLIEQRERLAREEYKAKRSAINRRLRREKEILNNFMRLRLYETESSFSGSEMDSSSNLDQSVDGDSGRTKDETLVSGEVEQTFPVEGSILESEVHGLPRGADIRKILRTRRRRRRHLLRGHQEQYTDKTRNAAVVMGEKDIGQSLQQQRRALAASMGISLPDGARPAGLTSQARAHRKAGQPAAALQLLEQALILDPLSERALLERSLCHQQLGQPRLALLDAEDALDLNKTNDIALFQKAQALYSMGHFERALVVFHRGNRIRPDNPVFKKGIQRSTEAIMNIIGRLSKDFSLMSCESLKDWPDRQSSIDSDRPQTEGASAADAKNKNRDNNAGAAFGVAGVESLFLDWEEDRKRLADAESSSGSETEHNITTSGVCQSCLGSHAYGEEVRSSGLLPSCDVEEDSKRIALILSVTTGSDGRNKHLRDSLMTNPNPASTSRPSFSVTGKDSGGAGSRGVVAGTNRDLERLTHRARTRPRRPSLQSTTTLFHQIENNTSPAREMITTQSSKIIRRSVRRPGSERTPPSLGQDVMFLEQIAMDPGLKGCAVSDLAEEGVTFLKNRQVFWQRRGPIHP